MSPANPRTESGNEILIAQDEVQRNAAPRRYHVAGAPVDKAGDVGEYSLEVARRHGRPDRRHRAPQIRQPLAEVFPLAFPFGQRRRSADEGLTEATAARRRPP